MPIIYKVLSANNIDLYTKDNCSKKKKIGGGASNTFVEKDTAHKNKVRAYFGGSIGAFFPSTGDGFERSENLAEDLLDIEDVDLDFNTAFGGSIFLGTQFNENWAIEVEAVLLGGNGDLTLTDSGESFNQEFDYSSWSVLFNPRFIIPLGRNNQDSKLSLFLSPGIGFSEADVDVEGVELESDISFTVQAKVGLSYEISNNVDLFLQGRWLYISDTVEDLDDSNVSFWSPEFGIIFKF